MKMHNLMMMVIMIRIITIIRKIMMMMMIIILIIISTPGVVKITMLCLFTQCLLFLELNALFKKYFSIIVCIISS